MNIATARGPVNIAVIKYWGKRNEELILPVNDSVSVTLSKEHMCATTTVACSSSFKRNRIWLNGKEQDMDNPRLKNCLRESKLLWLIEQLKAAKQGNGDFLERPVHICSKNNFPTAAGLASSAAGYACLVYALGSLYGVEEDLSAIARQGSGSACRSIFGGFVRWHKGVKDDGSDSIAMQIADKNHWPELRIIILVVNAEKKEISSTSGMQRSIETSELMGHRATVVVPQRVDEITAAILSKDFPKFAELTMKDSNQFHAICLDTYPPIRYMNSTSFKIVDLLHAYNSFYGITKVAYTFDAGPNACLYLLEKDVSEVLALIQRIFPSENPNYIRGLKTPEVEVPEKLLEAIRMCPSHDALQFILHTQVGDGPEVIEDSTGHLLQENGTPKE